MCYNHFYFPMKLSAMKNICRINVTKITRIKTARINPTLMTDFILASTLNVTLPGLLIELFYKV